MYNIQYIASTQCEKKIHNKQSLKNNITAVISFIARAKQFSLFSDTSYLEMDGITRNQVALLKNIYCYVCVDHSSL